MLGLSNPPGGLFRMKSCRWLVPCLLIPSLLILSLLILMASLYLIPAASAQEGHPGQPGADADKKKDADKETPIPPEKTVPTHHELTLGGKTLKYTATA